MAKDNAADAGSADVVSLKSLKAMGAVVDAAPIPRDITFTLDDGVERTFTIHVRRLSIGDFEKLQHVPGDDRSQFATVISNAVHLGEGGKEIIPYTAAYQFHPALANAMVHEVNEVNGGKKS